MKNTQLLNAFSLKSRMTQGCLLVLLLNIVLEALPRAISQENKRDPNMAILPKVINRSSAISIQIPTAGFVEVIRNCKGL